MSSPSPLSRPGAWNAVVDGYVTELVPLFSRYAEDALALAALPPRSRILDVAAGPGTLTLRAARDAEQVVAVDFAAEMVGACRREIAEAGLTNVEVHEADGQALPFADASFDGAFSMFGLMFFPDRAAGFRELYRVLRPGGRAVVSSWAPLAAVPLLAAFFEALFATLPIGPAPGGGLPLADPAMFRDEMRQAGFADVTVTTVQHEAQYASVGAFWEANARSSAPVVLMRQGFDAPAWEALRQQVVAALEARFGTGPVAAQWPAHLGVGTR